MHNSTPKEPSPNFANSSSATDLDLIVSLFRVLADPARLQTLLLLGQSELCVGDISKALNEKLSTTSQRLRLLRGLKLVVARRAGKNVFYRLSGTGIPEMVAIASQLLNAGKIPASLANGNIFELAAPPTSDGNQPNGFISSDGHLTPHSPTPDGHDSNRHPHTPD